MKDATILLIGTLAFGLSGGLMFWWGRHSTQRGKASLTWPMTPGRIVSSEVKAGAKGSFRADITYAYSVGGTPYTGAQVDFNAGNTSLNEATRIVAAHPPDSDATVTYNPAKPSQAILEPGVKGGMGITILGAVTLLIGLLCFGFLIAALARG